MRDKLSRREDRALLKAMRAIVLTQYPNPDRKDCPGSQVLHAIATKRIDMMDPAHEHVVACSPCFNELTDMRRALQRRKIFLWAIGATGTAVVVFAVWTTYFRLERLRSPVPAQTVQTEGRSVSSPGVQSQGETQKATPAITPPAEPKYDIALLDLRNASATRTVESADANPNAPRAEIRRGLLTLTIQLPVGADTGSYEVQIRDSNQQPIRTSSGQATIENRITELRVNLDTRSIQPGEYEFAWRLDNFNWRHYPISIR